VHSRLDAVVLGEMGSLEPEGLVDRLTLGVGEDRNRRRHDGAVDAVFPHQLQDVASPCEVDRLGGLAFGVENAMPGEVEHTIRLAHPAAQRLLVQEGPDVRTDPVFGDVAGILPICHQGGDRMAPFEQLCGDVTTEKPRCPRDEVVHEGNGRGRH
jgi:hypothetical protein